MTSHSAQIVWTDLSTFDRSKAMAFYQQILPWKYFTEADGYTTCINRGQPVAGLYTTPTQFQDMGLPSFWMTYIEVIDLSTTLSMAKNKGGKIELVDRQSMGNYALIRDPAGAGFTCLERSSGTKWTRGQAIGDWLGSDLFVSDAERVRSFYQELFAWETIPVGNEPSQWSFQDSSGCSHATLHEVGNDIKGRHEYWAVYFRVASLGTALQTIKQIGGEKIDDSPSEDIHGCLVKDNQGAAFYLVEHE